LQLTVCSWRQRRGLDSLAGLRRTAAVSPSTVPESAVPSHARETMQSSSNGEESNALAQRRAAFERLASVVFVPHAAQDAWLASTHYPVASFVMLWAAAAAHDIVAVFTCFVGALGARPISARNVHVGLGIWFFASVLPLRALTIIYGPDAMKRKPAVYGPSELLHILAALCSILYNVTRLEEAIVYQNRLAFLVASSTMLGLANIVSLLSYL
jgi:hypothetical protein